jgi:hypothetical protein
MFKRILMQSCSLFIPGARFCSVTAGSHPHPLQLESGTTEPEPRATGLPNAFFSRRGGGEHKHSSSWNKRLCLPLLTLREFTKQTSLFTVVGIDMASLIYMFLEVWTECVFWRLKNIFHTGPMTAFFRLVWECFKMRQFFFKSEGAPWKICEVRWFSDVSWEPFSFSHFVLMLFLVPYSWRICMQDLWVNWKS